MNAAMASAQSGWKWITRAAPASAPPNMQKAEATLRPAWGLVPPARDESDASPVSVMVRTVVVMSATPKCRTAALRTPMAKARSAITVKRGQPEPMAGTAAATIAATAVKVASNARATRSSIRCGFT